MKSINLPPLFFLTNPLRAVRDEIASHAQQSPYLKAILTGRTQPSKQEDDSAADHSDRAAASRYIKESRLLHKK